MANMNMIIHDMEGEIQIGDTFRKPKFRKGNRLQTFDRVVANPMWNQTEFKEKDYDADELDRFPKGAGFPGGKADWGWMQHILASLKPKGRAAVVFDTGAASRGSGNANSNKEKDVRKWFVEHSLSRVCSICLKTFSITPLRRASSYSSIRQTEKARRKAVSAERQPRVREGRSEELHSGRRCCKNFGYISDSGMRSKNILA